MDTRTLLDGYLRKAVNPSNHDLDVSAIDLFCMALKKDPSKMSIARELLVSRIQSTNTKESLLALEALEECMESLGREFRSEINKFRFLNELIKMVSKKYNGDHTPREVSDRILNILFTWTNKYEPCDCDKIQEAYNLLATQGIQHRSQQNVIVRSTVPHRTLDDRAGPALDKEQQKLRQLISSGKPENFEKANLLIQNIYRDEERRTQMKSRRLGELQKVAENTKLLDEMLDQYRVGETSDDGLAVLSEIYESCESAHPTIVRLAEETQHSEEMLEKIFEVNDALTVVLDKYREKVLNQPPPVRGGSGTESTTAMRYSPNIVGPDPLDTLFDVSGTDPTERAGGASMEGTTERSNYDDLSDIFASTGSNGIASGGVLGPASQSILQPQSLPFAATGNNAIGSQSGSVAKDNLMDIHSLLSSIGNARTASKIPDRNLVPVQVDDVKKAPPATIRNGSTNTGASGTSKKTIPELDTIISGMKATLLSGPTVTAEETSSVSTDRLEPSSGIGSEEDDPILAAPPVKVQPVDEKEQNVPTAPVMKAGESSVVKQEFKALADIVIDLDSILPSREPSRTVLDDKDGLQITLNFAADHPRPDVTVIVISTINQGRTEIPSFQFDASVRKPCKLRLLPPSATSLPGTKPFRPPADGITQVLLLANPSGEPVDLTCILTYLVGDDPDPIKESIVMQAVPSVRD
ncbi:ADP-ribosylation factor-binding protein GGA3 [Anopheles ziemanni]|uniref:ADP-ribosylation factor-binding protein GGA3 n=1 Tax=Anopheles coustani TaxID=139045 RepID=UPI002658D278|nr:ADP-ribosylation factor-binding protein GGA3 [Anopheles coustani]XP_058171412.1 ADP-ribosylation factor-binding protein GGA3 [Anopheles ziemanni]